MDDQADENGLYLEKVVSQFSQVLSLRLKIGKNSLWFAVSSRIHVYLSLSILVSCCVLGRVLGSLLYQRFDKGN